MRGEEERRIIEFVESAAEHWLKMNEWAKLEGKAQLSKTTEKKLQRALSNSRNTNGRNRSPYVSAGVLASELGYDIMACKLRVTQACWKGHEQVERQGFLQFISDRYREGLGNPHYRDEAEEKIANIRTQLEEIVSHLELARCDVQTDDPLVLLRPFFRNFKALQIDDFIRSYKAPKAPVERVLIYKHCFNGEERRLIFEVGASPVSEADFYKFNPYTQGIFDFSPQNAERTWINSEFCTDSLGSAESFVFYAKGCRIKHATGYLNRLKTKLKPDTKIKLDYLLQKFFRGEYDSTNPLLYTTTLPRGQEQTDTTIQTTINILFLGEEKSRLEKQIQEARLNMRQNWQSVPRLNLGMIKLPNPGQRDVYTDNFVRESAPYLVEYLSTLGIMTTQEAEDLAVRKLTNYFVHNSGFQLNRDNAQRIVDSLKSQTARKQEVA